MVKEPSLYTYKNFKSILKESPEYSTIDKIKLAKYFILNRMIEPWFFHHK